jgi:hypothetical protein
MLVYLQKMDHNSQQHSHMPLDGPAPACPLMPLADQYFCTHFNVLQAKYKQPNFYKQKRRHSQALIVLQKPQTTK